MPRRFFIDAANGGNAAARSALVAGKTAAGKQVPFATDGDGKLLVGGITVESLTATTVEIDQTTPGTTNAVVPTNTDGDEIFTESNPGVMQLSGSKMELYGATISDRPAANAVPVGATFTIVDVNLDQNWISNGTDWMEV